MKSRASLWFRYNQKTEIFIFRIYACIMPFIGGSGSALQVPFSSEAAWVIETASLPGPETQGQHSESTCDLGQEANPRCKVKRAPSHLSS